MSPLFFAFSHASCSAVACSSALLEPSRTCWKPENITSLKLAGAEIREDLLEEVGGVEAARLDRVGRDQVQPLHELAGRALLLQVVYERDRALGLLGFVGHEQARAHAGRRGDARAVY
jgi:hypothetical protein